MSLAYRDGSFIAKENLSVSLADFGFSRGLAVFDLIRIYGGRPFCLQDHLKRLASGAKMLGIAFPSSSTEITDIVHRLCAANKYTHSIIKIYLTAGESTQLRGASFAAYEGFTPHLFVIEEEIKPDHSEAPYGLELYKRGLKVKTVGCTRSLPSVKLPNYALGYHAVRMIAGPEGDDILFTQTDGSITEATTSNFFCVIDGVLCTPKEEILFGITRKVVLELAAKLGMPVAERRITSTDCQKATEAFLTSSIAELYPLRQIDDHVLTVTMDGPNFKKLRAAFTDYVAIYRY